MKIKHIFPHLILAVFFYLIGSFCAASFNITEWAEFGRVMLAFFYTCLTFGVLFYQFNEL